MNFPRLAMVAVATALVAAGLGLREGGRQRQRGGQGNEGFFHGLSPVEVKEAKKSLTAAMTASP